MVKSYFLILISSLLATGAVAQTPGFKRCASHEVLEKQLQQDPERAVRMQQIEAFTRQQIRNSNANHRSSNTVAIPVVVHVLYNTAIQNISDCQILSQIDVLNEDFRKLNADNANTPAVFSSVAADSRIQFVLAKRDPSGAPTTGITRTQTAVTTFSTNDAIKYTSLGGKDAWDTRNYLNFWIAPDLMDQSQPLLGYGQFPGGSRVTDGVVMVFAAFGSRAKCPGGVYYQGYDLGRTTTHEVGHLLNLYHIWGDALCGNDFVSDTPTQQAANFGCPTFPKLSCGNQGEMTMNYMDYTDDACMYMFTTGQAARMNATLVSGGYHYELTTSLGGTGPQPLPVELADFKGKTESNATVLSWATASEKDNDHFSIEGATNGQDFEVLGSVHGKGTSYSRHQYSFRHLNPVPGKNYYRLKQVDRDGKFTYSKIIVVENNNAPAANTSLYPNPVKEDLAVRYYLSSGQSNVQVEIFNLAGQLVAVYNEGARLSGNHLFQVNAATNKDFAALKNGLYLCRITGTGEGRSVRFTIDR